MVVVHIELEKDVATSSRATRQKTIKQSKFAVFFGHHCGALGAQAIKFGILKLVVRSPPPCRECQPQGSPHWAPIVMCRLIAGRRAHASREG